MDSSSICDLVKSQYCDPNAHQESLIRDHEFMFLSYKYPLPLLRVTMGTPVLEIEHMVRFSDRVRRSPFTNTSPLASVIVSTTEPIKSNGSSSLFFLPFWALSSFLIILFAFCESSRGTDVDGASKSAVEAGRFLRSTGTVDTSGTAGPLDSFLTAVFLGSYCLAVAGFISEGSLFAGFAYTIGENAVIMHRKSEAIKLHQLFQLDPSGLLSRATNEDLPLPIFGQASTLSSADHATFRKLAFTLRLLDKFESCWEILYLNTLPCSWSSCKEYSTILASLSSPCVNKYLLAQ
ncbi:hypothetical protein OGATHE_004483 [Ogataea polymorpha]|uniref:Uncharacterized protein n=1 Tax=Ogataea polymorpha TaxID=460523 RepID=A0A9P8P134_9ASCO|nr:hypothetical protein OGATHE_004483 [Ogataea polymorpha]